MLTPLRHTAQVRAGFLEDVKANRNLVFFMLTHSLWLSMPVFHTLSLEIQSSWGVHSEHRVIRIKKLPQHTSAERKRKHFQHQDEKQWAKDRALMHTNSHAKLLTALTTDSHRTSLLGIGHWSTCPGWHAQLIRWYLGSARPTTGPSVALIERLSQGWQRQSRANCHGCPCDEDLNSLMLTSTRYISHILLKSSLSSYHGQLPVTGSHPGQILFVVAY